MSLTPDKSPTKNRSEPDSQSLNFDRTGRILTVSLCVHFKLRGCPSGSPDDTAARVCLFEIHTHKIELETERTRCETIPVSGHIEDMHEIEKIFGAALDNSLAGGVAGLNDATAVAD